MLDILRARLAQGYRTMKYPKAEPPALSDRFRGLPCIDQARCKDSCSACAAVCPTGSITRAKTGGITMDLGKCLFCGECSPACPHGALSFTNDWRLSVRQRGDLLLKAGAPCRERGPSSAGDRPTPLRLAERLERSTLRLLGRSLRLRQVSAGGCNACEADCAVLSTVGWDMGRFGIQFVASPRHADGILVTGPVTKNMVLALEKTWAAVPSPKLVIAVGACAISGGPYIGSPEASDGVTGLLKVDLFIPGCPPNPLTVLDGLLRLIDRLR